MDEIKHAVLQALEKQGLISQLKAQLRAQVFLAVEEYESTSSGSGLAGKTSVPARGALFSDANGHLAIQLVLDFLDTCNLAFTKQVFQPELGPNTPTGGRQAAATKLGLKPSSSDEPLLLTLVRAFQSSAPYAGTAASSAAAPAVNLLTPAAAPAQAAVSPPAARPPLPSLGAAPKSSLAPLAPLGQQPPAQKPPMPPTSEPARTSSYTAPAPAAPAARVVASGKPAAEPSAESAYSDEAFEEEPVDEEEAVEEESAGAEEDEDEDDYATAMGFKPVSPPKASDLPSVRGGSTASGGLEAGDGGRERGDGGAGRRGRMTALDADLMAGDRSFGMSNELAGLDAGNSGGLSFSADFPPAGLSEPRASLSTSQAMLSPISEGTPKMSKLEPLKPLGASKLSPLAPLGPLPTIGTLSSSLNSSKDDPLAGKGPKPLAPLGGPGRKSMGDIEKEKEELRRLGLLQSGDSLGNSASDGRRPTGNIYDAEMSVSASMDDGTWERGAGSGGGARDDRLVFGSKGLSMDLRETGLSASDRSGDIEHMGVDLAETAEWH